MLYKIRRRRRRETTVVDSILNHFLSPHWCPFRPLRSRPPEWNSSVFEPSNNSTQTELSLMIFFIFYFYDGSFYRHDSASLYPSVLRPFYYPGTLFIMLTFVCLSFRDLDTLHDVCGLWDCNWAKLQMNCPGWAEGGRVNLNHRSCTPLSQV